MKRELIEAAIYRKILFFSEEDLQSYLEGGTHRRWLVDRQGVAGLIIAVIGEGYNHSKELKMVIDPKGSEE